jgi:methionine sulfoxide reductase heme-binding subunit
MFGTFAGAGLKMPFLRERSGRWSPVKIVAFAASILPALWIAYQAATDDLGARPVTEAIHQAGDWALRFLLITLAVTPAQRVLHYPRIILARRTLGVASAAYAILHLSLYILDQHFDLFKVASEIVLRIYLLIGALALTGLIALASTSTDAAISRLGSARWNALHRLVYGIAVLATVHFFIQSKLNIYQPVLMAGFLIWLLAYRGLFRRNGEMTPFQLLLLAFAVAVVTATGEALIYMFTSGVDSRRVLLAHFDLDAEVRPAWWVLATGLAVAALAFWRQKPARQRASRRPISASAMSGATQVQSGS